jgi:outer membrane protein assembly factor BamB
MIRSLCLLAVLALCSPCSLLAADWSQFRGPGGSGASSDVGLPVKWSASENIDWKTPLPGRGASSPVTYGDRVFLTAYSGFGIDGDNPGDPADLQFHVLCLKRDGGKLLWDKTTSVGDLKLKASRRIVDHGFASGTPTCDDTGVYAYFGAAGLVAYDLDGKLKWTAKTGTGTAGFGSASSPVLFGDLVIVNASIEDKSLIAFNKETGKQVWKFAGVNRAWTTPTIGEAPGGKPELIINFLNTVVGLDPETGKQLWTCKGIEDYVVPVPVVHEGVAYCLGGRSNRALAIRLGGRGDVSETHKLWEIKLGANVTSPVYHDGHLYWTSDRGVACCVKADTGEIVYQQRLPQRGRIYASVVLADGKIYVTTRDQGVLVLKAAPEYVELAHNSIDTDASMFNASPAISNGQLLMRTDKYLYCIGEKK